MKLFTSFVLSITVAVAVTHMAYGSPTPGKADAAKIQKNMAKNKGEFWQPPAEPSRTLSHEPKYARDHLFDYGVACFTYNNIIGTLSSFRFTILSYIQLQFIIVSKQKQMSTIQSPSKNSCHCTMCVYVLYVYVGDNYRAHIFVFVVYSQEDSGSTPVR